MNEADREYLRKVHEYLDRLLNDQIDEPARVAKVSPPIPAVRKTVSRNSSVASTPQNDTMPSEDSFQAHKPFNVSLAENEPVTVETLQMLPMRRRRMELAELEPVVAPLDDSFSDQTTWMEEPEVHVAPPPRARAPGQRPLSKSLAPGRAPQSPERPAQSNLANFAATARIPTTSRVVKPRVAERAGPATNISCAPILLQALIRRHIEPIVNLAELTAERIREMTPVQQKNVLDLFWEAAPSVKYKETYPFCVEGVVSKDSDIPNQLRVYSSRLGNVYVADSVERKNNDYVYFLVLSEQEYASFFYSMHPPTLISAKFPTQNRIVIRAYALLAHPRGRGKAEQHWTCWNDQLGMMRVISGAARISLKKMTEWNKQLDIVTIHASFENNKYIVTSLVALTNIVEKKIHLPEEAFLISDAVLREEAHDDFEFYSEQLDIQIVVKTVLAEGFVVSYDRTYHIVAAPTFPFSTKCVYRGLFISDNEQFWPKDNEFVKEALMERTHAFKKDARSRTGRQ